MYIPNDTAEERLKRTFFVVEATDFERFSLWQNYSTESWNPRYEVLKWEQINPGWSITVGHIYKQPICMDVHWQIIDNKWVMFWHPTSNMVDWKKCKKWLKENFPGANENGYHGRMCDANNFHLCVQAIKRANQNLVNS